MTDTGTETKLFLSASKPATRIPVPDFSQTRRDRGYNTLDFASKVRVPKGALPPLDSPIISVSRIQNRPCRFYILAPEIKKAPSPSSKGMLTVLLYIYPKVVFMQYCVSVSCGVVSLTKGTSGFPTGHRLGTYTQLIRHLLLGQLFFQSQLSEILWKILVHPILSFYPSENPARVTGFTLHHNFKKTSWLYDTGKYTKNPYHNLSEFSQFLRVIFTLHPSALLSGHCAVSSQPSLIAISPSFIKDSYPSSFVIPWIKKPPLPAPS